ncbi:MAG: DMT family transporter [Proteobacteria bacterium]|nr:DMT family transporter [Pseudomonadota bacterium]
MQQNRLPWRPIAALLFLAIIWGANLAAVKIAARDLSPMFMAAVRSLVASACLYAWMRVRNIRIFPSWTVALHGAVIGAAFGFQFALIFVGLNYTLASHTYVLIQVAPFVVAVGAHFLLTDDHLGTRKVFGLALAFSGVLSLFVRDWGHFSLEALPGDVMAMGAGFLWGASTVYIKKYLIDRIVPLQTLFYQTFFSVPVLFVLSALMEPHWVLGWSGPTLVSMLYQSLIVAFLSYLAWFALLHRYPASLLHSFTFFTPVCGVFISGALILGEGLSNNLIVALTLVSLGLVLVNRPFSPAAKPV